GIYVIEGNGSLVLDSQAGPPIRVVQGAFFGLGTHHGYRLEAAEPLKIVSVKKTLQPGMAEAAGLVVQTSLIEIQNTEFDVAWGNGRSRRFLLQRHGLGFSVMDTWVNRRSRSALAYEHHWESCLCIGDCGQVIDANGVRHRIVPGTIYILSKHDPHVLK